MNIPRSLMVTRRGEKPVPVTCGAAERRITMKNKRKIYHVIIKRWFDKINGNSYFSMKILNKKGDIIATFPFQYGYGSAPEHTALRWLRENRKSLKMDYLSQRAFISDYKDCKKKEVVSFGCHIK